MATPVPPDRAIKIKTIDVQRWCALTLDPLEDCNSCPQWCGVEGAYAILQPIGPEEKCNIERAWGLSPGQLQLVNPQTVITLRADWHASFDGRDCCILSHTDVMLKIYAQLVTQWGNPKEAGRAVPWLNSKGQLNLGLHRYSFIPIGKHSKTVPLVRHRFEPGNEFKELVPEVCDVYYPPKFDEYPEIYCLAHPHAVIWKAVKDFGKTPDKEFVSEKHQSMMQTAIDIVRRWERIIARSEDDGGRSTQPPSSPPPPDASDEGNDSGPSGPSSAADTSSTSPSAAGGHDVGYLADSPFAQRRFAEIPSEVSYTNNQPSLCFSSSGSQSAEAELISEDGQSDEEFEDEDERPVALAPYEPQDIEKWVVDSRSVDVGGLDDSFTDLHYPSTEPSLLPVDYDEEPAEVPHGDWGDWKPDFAKRLGERR